MLRGFRVEMIQVVVGEDQYIRLDLPQAGIDRDPPLFGRVDPAYTVGKIGVYEDSEGRTFEKQASLSKPGHTHKYCLPIIESQS